MRGMPIVKKWWRKKGTRTAVFSTILFGGLSFFAGCGSRELPSASSVREVRVDWLGHQAFRITSSIGTSLLTNPFAAGTGGRTLPSPLRPDILLISHERTDANNVDAADNQPTVFRGSMAMGTNNANGLGIRGIATFKDPDRETVEGMNIVYSWAMDGMRFCFLGSLAAPLSPAQVTQLGTVDVLFVPGAGSLPASARETVLSQIRPRLVIPMGPGGGWTHGSTRNVEGRSVRLSRPSLPLQTTTLHFGS